MIATSFFISYIRLAIIIILTVSVFGIFSSAISKLSVKKYTKQELELQKFNIRLNTPITTDLYTMLDTFIESCFLEYLTLHIEYKKLQYIQSDIETDIRNDLAKIVGSRISPIMMDKLTVLYNEDSIPEVIGNKCYLRVMAYVIENNTMKK